MRRPVLHSPPHPASISVADAVPAAPPPASDARAPGPPPASAAPPSPRPWRLVLAFVAGMSCVLAALLLWQLLAPPAPAPTPALPEIEAALRQSLAQRPLRSALAGAAEKVAPSVVRVVGYGRRTQGRRPRETGIGTGVVLVDKGLILTNLHVVRGAARIELVFSNGENSSASLVDTRPEHDLAVLQARRVPDDLVAATLRHSDSLSPGDSVGVIGFPYGIGPSVSAGVISGLDREFESPQGRRTLDHMIQFDAAANPGNSGGPLFTDQGEVVGIVTAILNPGAKTFIGIGFALPIETAARAAGLPPF